MDLAGDMDLAEDFVAHVVAARAREPARASSTILERDLAALERRAEAVPAHPLRRGDRAAASRRASPSSGATTSAPTRRPRSPSSFDRPVMVHRYPVECKAFYMKGDPADPRVALCVDVLAPEGYGEIIGGGQREDDLATLRGARSPRTSCRERPSSWYLDLRRYGSVPHAGFGLGIERVRRLDLRPAPRARDHPVPAHAGAPTPVAQRARARQAAPLRRRLLSPLVGAALGRPVPAPSTFPDDLLVELRPVDEDGIGPRDLQLGNNGGFPVMQALAVALQRRTELLVDGPRAAARHADERERYRSSCRHFRRVHMHEARRGQGGGLNRQAASAMTPG